MKQLSLNFFLIEKSLKLENRYISNINKIKFLKNSNSYSDSDKL